MIKLQENMLEGVPPKYLWSNYFEQELPYLAPIAARLLTMCPHSADVERACKAHKIVITTTRNRLKDMNTIMLVYCYYNMRLLSKAEEDGAITLYESDSSEEEYDEGEYRPYNSCASVSGRARAIAMAQTLATSPLQAGNQDNYRVPDGDVSVSSGDVEFNGDTMSLDEEPEDNEHQ